MAFLWCDWRGRLSRLAACPVLLWRSRTSFLAAGFVVLACCAWQAPELVARSERAKQLMAAGKFADAIPIYKELVQALPGNSGMVLNLALAEHMAGREQDAIPHFEAVLKSQPNLTPALISLGAARLTLNQPA